MKTAALIPAAGLGVRLGGSIPKGLRVVAAAPLLVHAVRRMSVVVDHVVVAVPPDHDDPTSALLADEVPGVNLTVVIGGVLRQDSVRIMLAALPPDITHVLVHDAARAFTPPDVASAVVAALAEGAAAVLPVLPVVDTVKRVDSAGVVVATVPRGDLRLAQTPQGFERSVLERAHAEQGSIEATDDASMVESLGLAVQTIPGSPLAMKITTPTDIVVAEALLEGVAG